MKRLVLIDILWIGLIVLAGLTWSLHDQSEYADRLDHFGLSESAVVVHTASTMTPAQAAKKLAASTLDNLQVQFQVGGRQPVVYFYGKGTYADLPITSGSWFSDADLQSALPVAVVGQTLDDQLFTGSNQRYLRTSQQYVPVLGVVATRKGSALNDVTFINASGAITSPAIKSLTVIADGEDIHDQTATLRRVLGATRTSAYTYQHGTQSQSWWRQNWPTVVYCALLVAAALGLSVLAARLAPLAATLGLDLAMTQAFIRGWWGRATAHVLVASVIGAGISWWAFYFTDYAHLLAFTALVLVAFSSGCYRSLTTRFHRAEGKA